MIEIRSLRDALRLLFIFGREFKLALLATLAVVILGAFLLPNRYVSDARLLVKPTESASVQLPVQPGPDAGFVQQSPQRDPLLDEEKLATSAPVMLKVAQTYLAMSSVPPKGGWALFKFRMGQALSWCKEMLRNVLVGIGLMDEAPVADRLAARLAKKLQVSHDPGSNVMEMRVSWNDPHVAQGISRAWVDAYFDERAKAAGGEALFNFYEEQNRELNDSIIALKRQLREQLRVIDATSVEQRIEDVTDQLQKLYRQRRELQAEREALVGILGSAGRQLPAVAGEVVTEREISLNPEREDLKLKLNGLKQQRLDLLRNFKEGAPPVRALDESIAALEAEINGVDGNVVRSRNVAPNALGARLRQDMQDARLNVAKIDANVAEIDSQIKQLQGEREEVMSAEPSLSRLSLELSSAEKTFAQYSDYLLRARVIRDLNRARLSNVALVGQSSFTPSRVFPKSMLMLLLSIPVAFAVALVVVFLLYLMDQRIHDGGRLEKTLGVPLLATVPEILHDVDGSQPLRAALYRIYCRLPLEQIAAQGLSVGLTSSRSGEGVSFIASRLAIVLRQQGYSVRDGQLPAGPGEVVLVQAPPVSDENALIQLRGCDRIVLVVKTRSTTLPAVENAIALLRDALGHVDGVVLNRRVFEIPPRYWKPISRWLGAY